LVVAWAIAFGTVWMLGALPGFHDAGLRAALADYLPTFPGGLGTVALLAVLTVHGASFLAWAGALQTLFVLDAKRVMTVGLAIIAYGTVVVTLAVRGWLDGELLYYGHLTVIALGFVALMAVWIARLIAEKVLAPHGAALLAGFGVTFSLATRGMTLRFLGQNDPRVDEWGVILLVGLLPLGAALFGIWALARLRHR
jgi:hypothetical protein